MKPGVAAMFQRGQNSSPSAAAATSAAPPHFCVYVLPSLCVSKACVVCCGSSLAPNLVPGQRAPVQASLCSPFSAEPNTSTGPETQRRGSKHILDHLTAELLARWKADTPRNLRHLAGKKKTELSTNFPVSRFPPKKRNGRR